MKMKRKMMHHNEEEFGD